MAYRIVLDKENFKFSGSHFTIFGPSHAERLHGHNYYVTVELRFENVDPTFGLAFDFNSVKPLVREITAELDEYVLLPSEARDLQLEKSDTAVRALFAQKRYEFPIEDVRILPLKNISSEELARYISDQLVARISQNPQLSCVTAVSIGVQETRGQSVYHERTLPGGR